MKHVLDESAVETDIEVRGRCHATCCEHDVREAVKRIGEAADDAGAAVAAKLEDAERLFKRARNSVEDGISGTARELKYHPFKSAAIAFATGMILGLLAPRLRSK